MSAPDGLYGLVAEFETAERILEAGRRAHAEGYLYVEAYTPFPVEGLAEAIGMRRDWVAPLVLAGGFLGGAGGYFMQWYSAVIAYPFNIGGRPYHSWPVFIIPTFELTVLGAALAAFFGMLALNGLPRLHHPIHNARRFDTATRNTFFLCIRSCDPRYQREATHRFLASLQPRCLDEVPEE